MGERDLRFRMYAAVTVVLAALGFAVSWAYGWPLKLEWLLVTLCAATLVSEALAVSLPAGAIISLTYPLNVSAIVLLGPAGAGVVAMVATLPYLLPRLRTSATRMAFNLGQIVLSALIAAWAYALSGGRPLLDRPLESSDFPRMVVPLLAAATLGVVANFGLGGIGYAMIQDLPLRRVWRTAFSWMSAPQLALGLLGLAIAQVMTSEGPLGFALFVVPLVVARQTRSRYLSLREAYADTVRSLVAALEAKDSYTKGHSVRVARFAVATAEAVGLDESQVQNVEYAALLHDLGKIGISRAVLAKSDALTDDEYERIREHPAIAARILESVPFLDSVRPAVQDHHERVDGRGYGRGLVGAALSIEAKILAVADSFDAMTADRPYRAAMGTDEAIAELRAHSGTQFDTEVVEAFLAVLPGTEAGEPVQARPAMGGAAIAEA
jgi:putative nucleotidyltransferase with HDIG domain